MPKIAGLSLMQIHLEEQEQQPVKQLSIENRRFLLNLKLGGLGSSQERGQCRVALLETQEKEVNFVLQELMMGNHHCWGPW